ncbi:MAG: hypothetical protein C7B45_12765 [Sulfobacillus acidophilus]|uniref:Uncharacterized protein n=1 Tax=Sulfobacillus acidophilus TaxID=53633 RepID=A0A2T2WFE1_9FIRM|nr:MAG: hypothetical protein C7B45_12765 [Sulfobacillus acidophilus]
MMETFLFRSINDLGTEAVSSEFSEKEASIEVPVIGPMTVSSAFSSPIGFAWSVQKARVVFSPPGVCKRARLYEVVVNSMLMP